MNVNDYLIAHSGKDWARLLKDWVPPLPERYQVWLVNRLGEPFVVLDDQSVQKLDVGSGSCVPVARSREHFAQLLDSSENADHWLRIRLVDACRRSGMTLGPFECYGFKMPPTLGGKYEASNLRPTHLAIHFSYQAYICKQADIYWIPPE
jgi:hypothetical protein